MPINANLKAQVQARINAAGNGSTLEELWNLKLIARGLDCNESNLNNLIELRLNEFGASTELKSLLQGALSVRPYARNIVWKTQTFLTSGTFTRPAKMVGNTVWATGCAAGGGGAWAGSQYAITGGWGGAYCINRPTALTDGVNSFPVIIPAGGAKASGIYSDGSKGGDLVFGSAPALLRLTGGDGGKQRSNTFGDSPYLGDFAQTLLVQGVAPLLCFSVRSSLSGSSNDTTSVVYRAPDIVNGHVAGRSVPSGALGYAGGGAPGLFGDGPSPSTSAALSNAAANTGAGGAGATNLNQAYLPGDGGSGRLDLGWWEYE